jgi:hypothetical protein
MPHDRIEPRGRCLFQMFKTNRAGQLPNWIEQRESHWVITTSKQSIGTAIVMKLQKRYVIVQRLAGLLIIINARARGGQILPRSCHQITQQPASNAMVFGLDILTSLVHSTGCRASISAGLSNRTI